MLREFILSEDGAASVDWVALTGGIMLLAFAVIYGIYSTGASSTSKSVNATLVTAGTAVNVGPAPSQSTFE